MNQPDRPSATTETDMSCLIQGYVFLPDFTEHPKPKRRKSVVTSDAVMTTTQGSEEGEVTFWQDFIAGGCAGSASVIVGHPLDTIKVRVQNSSTNAGLIASVRDFGGVSSLFRGMGAPLGSAAFINAIVFSAYGIGSNFYDNYIVDPSFYSNHTANHDPWQKSMACGSFAGLMQCFVICPMEHVKCRLQVQHGKGSPDNLYKGPIDCTRGIIRDHGFQRLYQGWWATFTREVPAFGLYFAVYDAIKDQANTFFAKQAGLDHTAPPSMTHTHTLLASIMAGGFAGSVTWGIVYPVDVIKTQIQTRSLNTPWNELSMYRVGRSIVHQYGWRRLFAGLGITLLRAFPVNGTIFPVYEFTLMHINNLGEN